jgi:hypothetical protein
VERVVRWHRTVRETLVTLQAARLHPRPARGDGRLESRQWSMLGDDIWAEVDVATWSQGAVSDFANAAERFGCVLKMLSASAPPLAARLHPV